MLDRYLGADQPDASYIKLLRSCLPEMESQFEPSDGKFEASIEKAAVGSFCKELDDLIVEAHCQQISLNADSSVILEKARGLIEETACVTKYAHDNYLKNIIDNVPVEDRRLASSAKFAQASEEVFKALHELYLCGFFGELEPRDLDGVRISIAAHWVEESSKRIFRELGARAALELAGELSDSRKYGIELVETGRPSISEMFEGLVNSLDCGKKKLPMWLKDQLYCRANGETYHLRLTKPPKTMEIEWLN